jgi:hypothetical protein
MPGMLEIFILHALRAKFYPQLFIWLCHIYFREAMKIFPVKCLAHFTGVCVGLCGSVAKIYFCMSVVSIELCFSALSSPAFSLELPAYLSVWVCG